MNPFDSRPVEPPTMILPSGWSATACPSSHAPMSVETVPPWNDLSSLPERSKRATRSLVGALYSGRDELPVRLADEVVRVPWPSGFDQIEAPARGVSNERQAGETDVSRHDHLAVGLNDNAEGAAIRDGCVHDGAVSAEARVQTPVWVVAREVDDAGTPACTRQAPTGDDDLASWSEGDPPYPESAQPGWKPVHIFRRRQSSCRECRSRCIARGRSRAGASRSRRTGGWSRRRRVSVGLNCDRAGRLVRRAEIGHDLAAGSEGRVKRAVRVIPHEGDVEPSHAAAAGDAHRDNLAVPLGAPAFAAPSKSVDTLPPMPKVGSSAPFFA